MTKLLCCLLSPEMGCGFCTETWCNTCYYELGTWPRDACPVPNTSGSDQGNHYTKEIDSIWPIPDSKRPLHSEEKVTDFDCDYDYI